jgi:ribosome-dependent ATPase
MTAYGMLISAFTRTQIAALFGTAILTVLPATQFAGMMTPVSSLATEAQIMGRGFPDDLFRADQRRHFHQGTRVFGPERDLLALAIFVPILTLLSVLLLRKQER